MKVFRTVKTFNKVIDQRRTHDQTKQRIKSVLTLNTRNPARVKIRSEIIKPFPISTLVYFLRIIAITSVPPLEAPILNKIAEPSAGNKIAKINSNNGSLVSG